MSITPQDYNDDAIKGAQLSKLMENEIRDRIKGDVPETLAHALCVMAAEIDALKAALAARNIGEHVADSLDAQVLKIGGVDAINSVKAASGSDIATPGTPSVDVSIDGNEATLTFHKLKGSKGDKGDTGTAAGFGTPTATVDADVGTPSVSVSASGPNTAKVFSFAFSNLKGVKGDKGDKGDTGNNGTNGTNGVGVSSVTMNYAASSSGTTAPTTGWQTSVPSVSGQYLWSRADILLTNNTHQYIYSVSFIPEIKVSVIDGPQQSYTQGVLYLI